jgi:hypothetical protein
VKFLKKKEKKRKVKWGEERDKTEWGLVFLYKGSQKAPIKWESNSP